MHDFTLHPLFKSTSTVDNIQSCVKSTQLLTQEFQNSPHFFQSRTNPNSKKALCYTFNVRTIISTKIMTEHTESMCYHLHKCGIWWDTAEPHRGWPGL